MIMSQLEPVPVWHAFEEISRIPRGNGNEERIAAYIHGEANAHHLKTIIDSRNNVYVWLPATEGRALEETVVMEAHMDKISVKAEESEHEFEEDGIEFLVEDDRIRANGTTLGADNGIGVAMLMGLMRSNDFSHPPIELIFTSDKVHDRTGAHNLEPNLVDGKRLINLDYEVDSLHVEGAAGIMMSQLQIRTARKPFSKEKCLTLDITAPPLKTTMRSGQNIWCSPIDLLTRILTNIRSTCQIVILSAGELGNAMPTRAEAVLVPDDCESAIAAIENLFKSMSVEWPKTWKPELSMSVDSKNVACYTEITAMQILSALMLMPTGSMQRQSRNEEGIFISSIAMAREEEDHFVITDRTRYARHSMADSYADRLRLLADMIGAMISSISKLPVWEPVKTSDNKKGEMDAIAIAPEIYEPHTVNESVSIASVKNTYEMLKEILTETRI